MSNKNCVLFINACRAGKLRDAKRIHFSESNIMDGRTRKICSADEINFDIDYERAFEEACNNGHLNIVRWIYSLGIDIYHDISNIVHNACENGFLDIVQWIYPAAVGSGDWDPNTFLHLVCENGHLDIAQWIYSQGENVHIRPNYIFSTACKNGHLHVAQWIYSQAANIITTSYRGAWKNIFVSVCARGHLHIAQWLYSLDSVDTNVSTNFNKEKLFYAACAHGHLSVAQWIYSKGEINIHHKDDRIFKCVCVRGYLDIAQWLYSLSEGIINVELYSAHFVDIIENDLDMLQFLLERGLDIQVEDCVLLEYFSEWSNQLETHQLLLQYCSEEHYPYLDEETTKLLLNRTKNARKD